MKIVKPGAGFTIFFFTPGSFRPLLRLIYQEL